MKEKIKPIYLILITTSLMVCVGFYAWDTWEKQRYFEIKECKERDHVYWDYNVNECLIVNTLNIDTSALEK